MEVNDRFLLWRKKEQFGLKAELFKAG